MKQAFYVIKNKDTNKYIDIDLHSGGYPYECDLMRAHRFMTYKDAEEYLKIFERSYKYKWIIKKAQIRDF